MIRGGLCLATALLMLRAATVGLTPLADDRLVTFMVAGTPDG